jgi:hypothetical protein
VESAYQVAPIFSIRMAGIPFETIEGLATCETCKVVRELLVRQKKLAETKINADQVIRSGHHGLSAQAVIAWRAFLRSGQVSTELAPLQSPELAAFAAAAAQLTAVESRFEEIFESELNKARVALLESARTVLPPYLIFGAETVRELVPKLLAMPPVTKNNLPPRKKSARARERHLLLFLQRVCAKNDTLSEFGPGSWGRVAQEPAIQSTAASELQRPHVPTSAVSFAPQPGVAKRESFLERWAAHGVAAALNADPAVRAELSPRLHPHGRIEGDQFLFTDTGDTMPLDPQTREILARCDGATPAHSLGVELKTLVQLAEQHIIRWEVEVPALDPHAFDVLLSDITLWRDTPAHARWLQSLDAIAALPSKFVRADQTMARIEIMDEARQRLQDLGSARATSDRFLYSAINPIGEECFRECHFQIGPDLINEVANDAAPWIDLWRDCYAFIASRVASGLRDLLEKAASRNGTLALPAFLRHCESLKMSLKGPALVGLAHLAFQEVKAAFRERLKPHAQKAEYELTPEDCHFVRNNFRYEKFDEYTYPSADLQIAAKSTAAVTSGQYQWILAELHPPVALLHHGFYWSCPDKAALRAALTSTVFGQPNFHFGFFAADFTGTTAVSLPNALPELSNFVASQRGHPDWRMVSPAETEVYVHPISGDVCLRKVGTDEHLGSFARAWLIPLGFHPFQFGMVPHMPRLLCRKVIVQRRSWTVNQKEWPAGDYTGVSRDLVLAIERLRAEKDLPRYIYIRPTEQALRRSGAEGRDKDTKPVFIDLESYLFLEIFHRWLTKSGELEVTEMLPDPDHLPWREPDGRRTFELRTLIVPRGQPIDRVME